MSKDIRSFFIKASKDPPEKGNHFDSKSTKKRHHKVIESDDEGEDLSKKVKDYKSTANSIPGNTKTEVVVQVENFFGDAPVTQKMKKCNNNKKNDLKNNTKEKSLISVSTENFNKKINKYDFPFENDDELEASLLETEDEHLLSGWVPSKRKKKQTDSEDINVQNLNDFQSDVNKIKKLRTKKISEFTENKSDPDTIALSEKKKKSAEAYQKYLNRGGPKNPGTKTIPKGSPTCLQGLNFVITGVLDSLEREEAVKVIQKFGGHVGGQISKKTNFLVVGEEPGVSKIKKAEHLGTKKINEDDLLKLIETKTINEEKNTLENFQQKSLNIKNDDETHKIELDLLKAEKLNKETLGAKEEKIEKDILWVEKYKPKTTKHIIGQNGEKSNVKKLTKWLQNWHKNHSNKLKKQLTKPAPWIENNDGSYFKAALLSGPPGVGKTTTVHLVCAELDFDVIEFNASDTRSKKLLQEEVLELLSSKSIRGYFQGDRDSYKKHVLLMDEVDGMAGNEDRGGIQELIQLIKHTKVPIVGICNDRNHPKMRSLVNHCFDLRFQKPRLEQIKGAMKSICFRESIEISGEALEELIIATNHDVRQVLHNLSLLSSFNKNIASEEVKSKSVQVKKPLNLGPWDVVRKVFSAVEHEKMKLADKTDLFFQDYSLGPLFVQETYVRVKPYKAKNNRIKQLELISKTIDSLALGDTFERTIRSQNAWNLLPVQAVFSSVLPGYYMSGHIQGQVQFPIWLGKNSKKNKFDRLLQDLSSSLKASITATKDSLNLDYLHKIKDSIIEPLAKEGLEGIQEAVKFMLEYQLTKEDLEHIIELTSWPGVTDKFAKINPKVKSALTRALNKEGQLGFQKLKKMKIKQDDEDYFVETEEEIGNEDNDNVDLDPMIKKVAQRKVKKELKGRKKK